MKSALTWRAWLPQIVLTVLLNALLPWLVYLLLIRHFSSFTALSAAAFLPLIENIVYLARYRRLDTFGSLMLGSFVLAALLAFMGGDERVLLVRGSIVTGAVGAAFLLSLLLNRPLIYGLAKRFVSPETAAKYEEGWHKPQVRRVFRIMTAVWGAALLLEAAVRTLLVYTLPVAVFLGVSNLVFYGFIGAAALWTWVYRKRSTAAMNPRL
ncbi:VC0807 family protein [Paenibacillus zeisoli]|uniref:VC0807 family protein n=1 Tax=Paenibacillus zeisoli TaxID=2496267 RepID=UPI001FEBB602|nr:VC0807 family protein [Paenibacillus zeisoli]